MLKIAITGNIASGKSQVEKILAEYFPVYDTDNIAHDILDDLTEFYGFDVFTNGKMDRKKLGNLVFNDFELKKKLEEIVHPRVKEKIIEIFEKHKNDKVVFISIPLLFESGFETLFDKVLLISVSENIRIERLMQRDNLTREDALKRIKSQMDEREKIKMSDYLIYNNSTIYDLDKNVRSFIKKDLCL